MLQNYEPEEIEDWKKEIVETKQWLNNLQDAISKPEFTKLHGNIERIQRINNKLDAILSWLNKFQ